MTKTKSEWPPIWLNMVTSEIYVPTVLVEDMLRAIDAYREKVREGLKRDIYC